MRFGERISRAIPCPVKSSALIVKFSYRYPAYWHVDFKPSPPKRGVSGSRVNPAVTVVVVQRIQFFGNAELAQVVHAGNVAALAFYPSDSGQEHGGENRDEGDDDDGEVDVLARALTLRDAHQKTQIADPIDDKSFLAINGVGLNKLEKFGQVFIKTICVYTKKHKINSVAVPTKVEVERPVKVITKSTVFYIKTKELVQKKIPIKRIAKHQDLAINTVINHLEKLIDAGERLDLDYLKLPRDRYEIMTKAFKTCGDEKLKPVFEYLKGKYDYDELKLVRVLLRT